MAFSSPTVTPSESAVACAAPGMRSPSCWRHSSMLTTPLLIIWLTACSAPSVSALDLAELGHDAGHGLEHLARAGAFQLRTLGGSGQADVGAAGVIDRQAEAVGGGLEVVDLGGRGSPRAGELHQRALERFGGDVGVDEFLGDGGAGDRRGQPLERRAKPGDGGQRLAGGGLGAGQLGAQRSEANLRPGIGAVEIGAGDFGVAGEARPAPD